MSPTNRQACIAGNSKLLTPSAVHGVANDISPRIILCWPKLTTAHTAFDTQALCSRESLGEARLVVEEKLYMAILSMCNNT